MGELNMRARELPVVPNLKWIARLETADAVEAVRKQLKSETKTHSENYISRILV
jgi:hypothetical protein